MSNPYPEYKRNTITVPMAEQPAQQQKACPTCGEYEPRTGTCGTSQNDKRALCNRNASQPAQQEPVAWVPYLSDRADGVSGHYAIARWNPRGYREVWNLRRHAWGAYSDDVLSLEEADTLLRLIEIPTRKVETPQPAQPQQEPVAWAKKAMELAADLSIESLRLGSYERKDTYEQSGRASWQTVEIRQKREGARERLRQHLYTSPPAPSQYGSPELQAMIVARAIEKDKSEQPAQQQEPVAYFETITGRIAVPDDTHRRKFPMCYRPLVFGNTSPPAQRKPLTDEQIADILPDDDTPMSLGEAFVKFARAIEAAHGIKEQP